MTWEIEDLTKLGPTARESALAQLKTRAETWRKRGLPVEASVTEGIRLLTASLAPVADTTSKGATRPVRARVHGVEEVVVIPDLPHGGSLVGWGPWRCVLALIDDIKVTNTTAGRNGHVIDRLERLWEAHAIKACQGVQPFTTPVEIGVWPIRKAGGRAKLADADAIHFAQKGAVDGLVRAGLIADDGPGWVRAIVLNEFRWASQTGIILDIRPALQPLRFPIEGDD